MPWNVPQKYYDLFPLDTIELPPHTRRTTWTTSRRPASRWPSRNGDHARDARSRAGGRRPSRRYLAAIAYCDAHDRPAARRLDKSPHKDNTIIVFWGDHGWHLGEKEHWRKFALWEEATRTPLIWVAPGVTKPGGVCDRTVDLMSDLPDAHATSAASPTPKHVEGEEHPAAAGRPEGEVGHARRSRRTASTTTPSAPRAGGTSATPTASEELYDEAADPLRVDEPGRQARAGRAEGGTGQVAAGQERPRHRRPRRCRGGRPGRRPVHAAGRPGEAEPPGPQGWRAPGRLRQRRRSRPGCRNRAGRRSSQGGNTNRHGRPERHAEHRSEGRPLSRSSSLQCSALGDSCSAFAVDVPARAN